MSRCLRSVTHASAASSSCGQRRHSAASVRGGRGCSARSDRNNTFRASAARSGPYNALEEEPVNDFPVIAPTLMGGGGEPMSLTQHLYCNRTVFLNRAITEDVASRTCAELMVLELDDPKKDIKLYLHTKAISTYALNALVDVMTYVKPDVSTVCIGTVAGVAAVLLGAGARGKRFAMPNSRIMLCQPKTGAEGDIFEVKRTVDEGNRQFQFVANLLERYTNLSLEECEQLIDRETYMSAQEALDIGLIDAIL